MFGEQCDALPTRWFGLKKLESFTNASYLLLNALDKPKLEKTIDNFQLQVHWKLDESYLFLPVGLVES